MALNWIGTTRYYSCEMCHTEATVLDTDHGDFCQRCYSSPRFGTEEFLDLIDQY